VTADHIVQFDSTTGKLVKDGGVLGTMAAATATDYVTKALYDAETILAAVSDNTPAALTVGASTIVGRKAAGDIVALTGAEAAVIEGAVVGPASATDNAIVRYDATTGKLVQNSGPTIDDGGSITTVNVHAAGYYYNLATVPSFWFEETGAKGALILLYNGVFQYQRHATGYGAFEASPVNFNMGSPGNSLNLLATGSVIVGQTTGGLHVGGSSEPGDNNLLVDGNADAQSYTLNGFAYFDLFLRALARHGALTNLIANGDFETDVAGWYSGGATVTRTTVSPLVGTGSLKCVSAGGCAYTYPAATGIVGHVYFVGGLAKSTAAAGRKVVITIGTGGSATGIAVDCSASTQPISLIFTATGTSLYPIFQLDSYVLNEDFRLDSVVCYDLSA
jgi:hypothetical protein